MTRIDVLTGSRLHFGLICGTVDSGWQFGGVGLMLRQPSWRMTVRPRHTGEDRLEASPETTIRIQAFLRQIRTTIPLKTVDVIILEEVPFHAGLGGGTQLGLALAAASILLSRGRLPDDPCQLAQLAQRAERSAIGTAGFRYGGFLIDHGLPAEPDLMRRVDRVAVPEAWRFLLVRPVQARGLSGDKERDFFRKHIHMTKSLVERLGEQIEHQLVPAVRQSRFDEFASALESYGQAVGSFYAAEQGDVFAHPVIRQLVAELQSRGVRGAAQSSWGPGICIPARSMSQAQSITDMITEIIPGMLNQTELSVLIAEPLNTGASLLTPSPEASHGQLA